MRSFWLMGPGRLSPTAVNVLVNGPCVPGTNWTCTSDGTINRTNVVNDNAVVSTDGHRCPREDDALSPMTTGGPIWSKTPDDDRKTGNGYMTRSKIDVARDHCFWHRTDFRWNKSVWMSKSRLPMTDNEPTPNSIGKNLASKAYFPRKRQYALCILF